VDKNKLQVLRDIKYTIAVQCGLCKHARFAATEDFGVCSIQTYEHQKHTGEPRLLSINRAGSCPKAEIDEDAKSALGPWSEFVE
jgi:hypothetical protein